MRDFIYNAFKTLEEFDKEEERRKTLNEGLDYNQLKQFQSNFANTIKNSNPLGNKNLMSDLSQGKFDFANSQNRYNIKFNTPIDNNTVTQLFNNGFSDYLKNLGKNIMSSKGNNQSISQPKVNNNAVKSNKPVDANLKEDLNINVYRIYLLDNKGEETFKDGVFDKESCIETAQLIPEENYDKIIAIELSKDNNGKDVVTPLWAYDKDKNMSDKYDIDKDDEDDSCDDWDECLDNDENENLLPEEEYGEALAKDKQKSLTEEVAWDVFDKYADILHDYLPRQGEGDTKASQFAVCISKLVYRFFNDGDYFTNQYCEGKYEAGDESMPNYANWLSKYIDGAGGILDEIKSITYEDDDAYSDMLYELCTQFVTEEYLEQLDEESKTSESIYKCSGEFKEIDWEKEYGDEYDESLRKSLNEGKRFNIKDDKEMNDARIYSKLDPDKKNEFVAIDPNQESKNEEDRAQPGDALLECKNCKAIRTMKTDDLVKDPDSDTYNKGDKWPCPHCGAKDGYNYIAQLASPNSEDAKKDEGENSDASENDTSNQDSNENEINNTSEIPTRPETSTEEKKDDNDKEQIAESFDNDSFDKLITNHLTSLYENVRDYKTLTVTNKGNDLILEGVITSLKGSTLPTKFILSRNNGNTSNSLTYNCNNKLLSESKNPFKLNCTIKNKALIVESMDYNYTIENKGQKYSISE